MINNIEKVLLIIGVFFTLVISICIISVAIVCLKKDNIDITMEHSNKIKDGSVQTRTVWKCKSPLKINEQKNKNDR